ncbi:MAG: dephospho-CoA kinase [Acidimicrobiia bacterium]
MISRTIGVLLMGGIGTGKSALSGFLRERGVEVIDADHVGHEVLEAEAFQAVSERWPQVVRDGNIDRSALVAIVFADRSELRHLEGMTHPHIAARIEDLAGQSSAEVVVVELPVSGSLLSEGWIKVAVTAPEGERLARLKARGMSEEDARARMAAQPEAEAWAAEADIVLDNSGPLSELPALADELLSRIRAVGGVTPAS